MTRFAILGPGGVGGLLAAALDRAGADVTVIAREATAALIAERGISVRSETLGEFVARPRAVASLEEAVDILFVATKAVGLEAALDRVKAPPAVAIPLLNGVDGVERLRRRFAADTVAAGTIRVEADRPEPAVITHTSKFLLVEVAFDGPPASPTAAALGPLTETLSAAGVPARVGVGEQQVLWSKAVRLCALASTTAAADRPIGFIRCDPAWRARLHAVIRECAAVARADGAPADPAVAIAELDAVHETLGSSMQRDLQAGREPELDAIQGSVLRAGRRHGLSCPTIAALAAQIARRAGIDPPRI